MSEGDGKMEWRVVLHGHAGTLETNLPSEADAREYAEMERADYPHYNVTVECRTVSPWREA